MSAESGGLRKIALSGLAGTAVEYYDFMLYATMTALVFDKLFFPGSDPSVAAVAAFGTLAAGYAARPVGAILFGHLGDRLGRKRTLITTMSLMGVASFLIGCLPTYETIGRAAPVLLVLLRVGQGIAVGGEWGGAILMLAEHAQPSARGRWNGYAQMGTAVGSVLSTVVVAALAGLPHPALMSWGWRVPFLLSAALLVIGLYVRVRITESPVFVQAHQSAPGRKTLPFAAVLRRPGRLAVACLLGVGPFALTALISTYMLAYARNIGYPMSVNLTAKLAGAVALMVATPVFAALSDRLGRRTVMLGGAVTMVLYAYPMFVLVDSVSTSGLITAVVLGQIIEGSLYGPMGATLSEMFDTEFRYTGVSLGYQVAALIGGGFTPLLASSLLMGGPRSTPLVLIVVGCGLVTVVALLLAGETKDRDLTESVDAVSPTQPTPRRFGQLPNTRLDADFDAALPDSELAPWEGTAGADRAGG